MSVDKFGRFDQNVKDSPTDLQNLASLDYVKNNFLPLSSANNHYDAQNRCIRNISLPLISTDAVNMQYLKNYTLERTTDMHFSVNNKFIRELRDPVLPSDAATMGYVTKCSLKRTQPDGNVDLEGKLLRNIANPILPTDAVNMEYLTSHTPKLYETHWMFDNKKLSNVQDAAYDGEAVNLRTLRHLGLVKGFTANSHYDAKGLKVINIGKCKNDGDAVNFKVLKDYVSKWITHHEGQLERLSAAIFDYIHRSLRTSAELGVTNTNYLDWNTILNKKIFEEDASENEYSRREKGDLDVRDLK